MPRSAPQRVRRARPPVAKVIAGVLGFAALPIACGGGEDKTAAASPADRTSATTPMSLADRCQVRAWELRGDGTLPNNYDPQKSCEYLLSSGFLDESKASKLDDILKIHGAFSGATSATDAGLGGRPGSIAGTISVGHGIATEFRKDGEVCSTSLPGAGMEGYGDIASGTQVVAKNQSGTIIGTSALQTGHWKKDAIGFMTCEFPFTVGPLPMTDFYTLTIGRRGDQSYSRADLDQRNWHIDLTLS